jgi:hypothetical protein
MFIKLKPEPVIEQYELLPLLEKLQDLGIGWDRDMLAWTSLSGISRRTDRV